MTAGSASVQVHAVVSGRAEGPAIVLSNSLGSTASSDSGCCCSTGSGSGSGSFGNSTKSGTNSCGRLSARTTFAPGAAVLMPAGRYGPDTYAALNRTSVDVSYFR